MTFVPVTLGSGLAGYNYLSRTRDTQQAIFDRSPVTAREVTRAAEKLKDVQTVDDLMADRTLLKVALGAFGLDEDLDNRAFIRRILESDLDDRQSLVNRLTDKRYLSLAKAFNFSGSDGPQLPNARDKDDLIRELEGLQSADDLLRDPPLLRAALERFGLEANQRNTYFLKQVLESDLSDPTSFANRMPDERLAEFARVFDFHGKQTGVSDIAPAKALVDGHASGLGAISSARDLLDDPEMLEKALGIFGLDDIYTDSFLEDVLNSNLNDSASFARTQADPRFAAFAAAFSFATQQLDSAFDPVFDSLGNPVMREGTLARFVEAFEGQSGRFGSAEDFLSNRTLREATFDLLGIPKTFASRKLAERVLSSEPGNPKSFANLFPDARFGALADLIRIEAEPTGRVYPEGFVDQVVRNYLDRQFEIRVGETDPDMRIALALEREIGQVVKNAGSNDAQWFSIMSSPPLRQAFEGAFRLPSSFGSIDIDQQLQVLKTRSERFLGTSKVEDFLQPERLDDLRRSFLINSSARVIGTTSSASVASILLSNL